MSKEQQAHPSETALDNTTPDYWIINDGTLKDLKEYVIAWLTDYTGFHQTTFDEL